MQNLVKPHSCCLFNLRSTAHAATVVVNQTQYLLELLDTAAQEDYDQLQPLSYNNADIFFVCYSVVIPST